MGQSFEMLPVEERALQYRQMADATFLKASKLEDQELRAQYLGLASRWHTLAQSLEAGKTHLEAIQAPPSPPDDDILPGEPT
jgi:hypothetical protein